MNQTETSIHVIGYASGIAGVNPQCGDGPIALQKSDFFQKLKNTFVWDAMIQPAPHFEDLNAEIKNLSHSLAIKVAAVAHQKKFFLVIGGDHSSAVGTWSGVYDAKHKQGPFGLIWLDAHMDSHIPETSLSGRIHGMPLACLLGKGDKTFTGLLHDAPKLLPENVCLIGVRSFEAGEADILKQLNVRIFFMDEVKKRGLADVFNEALQIVNRGTIGYGISLDVDSIDPSEAPGVDVPEPDGISAKNLNAALTQIAKDPRFLGAEVVEFDPHQDIDQMTEKLVIKLISAMTGISD